MPRRPMTIRRALEWAFGEELAQLDFDEAKGDNARPGVSTLWVIAQRGNLGCTVDGGGRSLPHHDADMIASAVAHMPAAMGGRRMALLVAECARAGSAPDWRSLPLRIEPVAWKGENQHGRVAVTEPVLWPVVVKGRVVQVPAPACPVRVVNPRERAEALRARYTAWRAALSWAARALAPRLSEVQILPGLPPPAPWVTMPDIRRAG